MFESNSREVLVAGPTGFEFSYTTDYHEEIIQQFRPKNMGVLKGLIQTPLLFRACPKALITNL
jgi:hypothetical protein